MGANQTKEANHFDQLQDSRDAMKTRDENHMKKVGKDGTIEFVPGQENMPHIQKDNQDLNKNIGMVKPMPSIQCTED